MKLKIMSLVTAILILAISPIMAEETSPEAHFIRFTGRVTGNKVRLRTDPSLEGHIVRETYLGEHFIVTGEEDDFYSVIPHKGTKGYVFRTLILDGVVEAERVNIRLYPDVDAPVIGRLNANQKVNASLSSINNKWLEIDLDDSSRFFIAKEYMEKSGPVEMLAEMEARQQEASHHLNAACLFAQSEIQKPFEEISLEKINEKFESLASQYQDLSAIVEKVREASSLIQESYIEKKITFLERKAGCVSIAECEEKNTHEKLSRILAETPSSPITDKMLLWKPIEESLYHIWAEKNGEGSLEAFYQKEAQSSITLTGILESYNKPVKNRPGDFILKDENSLPIAFLYSTRVNLEEALGKKVSLTAITRPNNHFAFPAYYVLNIE